MKKSTKMFFLAILVGTLLVAAILTFVALGISHPVPWILLATVIAIPLISNLSEHSRHVKWKDSYSVGIESIDEDHRKLFNLINQLQTAIHYQTGENFEKQALDDLVDYTRYHFQREEGLMAEHGYPDLVAHKGEHEKMIAKVEQFLIAYQEQGHDALEGVADFLKDWLVHHINGTDKAYSPFLREKGVS